MYLQGTTQVRSLSRCLCFRLRVWLADHLKAQHIALGKAKVFLSQLDTAEKIGLVTGSYGPGPVLPCVGTIAGIPRLNFSGLCYSDGPTGYARSDGVSVFPSGVTVAATWDRDLMYQRALAIGEEFRAKGAHAHLGYDPPDAIRTSRPS